MNVMNRSVKHQCSLQLDEATQMEDSDSSNQIFIKPEHMDVRTSIAEIEHELEDVLLNTILNHEVFVRNIPLNIEITVTKKIKTEVDSQNKEINVKLTDVRAMMPRGENNRSLFRTRTTRWRHRI